MYTQAIDGGNIITGTIYHNESDNKIRYIEPSDPIVELIEYLLDNPDDTIESLVKENEKLKLENLNLKTEVEYYKDISIAYEQRIKQLQEKYEVKQ